MDDEMTQFVSWKKNNFPKISEQALSNNYVIADYTRYQNSPKKKKSNWKVIYNYLQMSNVVVQC